MKRGETIVTVANPTIISLLLFIFNEFFDIYDTLGAIFCQRDDEKIKEKRTSPLRSIACREQTKQNSRPFIDAKLFALALNESLL